MEVWTKNIKNIGNLDAIFPALHPEKSTQHIPECAADDGAICSKNRKLSHIIGSAPILEMTRMRSPSPIMASVYSIIFSLTGSNCDQQTFWATSSLAGFFDVLSTNRDRNGLEFVSTVEGTLTNQSEITFLH